MLKRCGMVNRLWFSWVTNLLRSVYETRVMSFEVDVCVNVMKWRLSMMANTARGVQ